MEKVYRKSSRKRFKVKKRIKKRSKGDKLIRDTQRGKRNI